MANSTPSKQANLRPGEVLVRGSCPVHRTLTSETRIDSRLVD
jgi:hypothetical protein